MIALLLLGCQSDQVRRIEADLKKQERRAADLRRELDALHAAIERAQAYWAHREPIHVPEDYDRSAPMPSGGDRPDVLLFSIDTLRADHLGSYGYERDTSPFMDQLASTGARYEQMWSPAPWTLPSHTTMLTGLLPDAHGAFEDDTPIPASLPMLQEQFSQAGYATAGVVSTLFVSRRFGFQRGFDFFEDFSITDKAANNRGTVDAEEVFATAHHWAQQQPDGKPMFLFLHSYDVHYAYNAPQPYDSHFDRPAQLGDERYRNYHHYAKRPLDQEQMDHQVAQYDEEIRYVDAQLEAFVTAWRASGRELIVAITSDHGEEFGERGSWGHAHTLYPEQLHVPLIVNGPGIRPAAVDERAGSEDLAPTLAGLAGLEFPRGDGRDRTAQLRTGARVGVSGLYAETSRFDTAKARVHHDGLDLIVDLAGGSEELYDLRADPEAEQDLRARQDAAADRLRDRLSKRWGTPWHPAAPGTVQPVTQAFVWRNGLVDTRIDVPFAVFPPDGRFNWVGARKEGPFEARKDMLPAAGGLTYHGRRWSAEAVELTGEETRMLETLGYLQD